MGTFNCDITYDKVSHYEGEYALGPTKNRKLAGREKLKLFKGQCPTKNLFSILD
jgi:hypothetical protein